jgi:uncharacterized protein with HEPN domain
MKQTPYGIVSQAQQHLDSLIHHLSLDDPDPQLLLDGAALRLSAIIECLNQLSPEFREDVISPGVWSAMKGLRNRLAHAYGFIDSDALFQTITNRTPEIAQYLDALLIRTQD